MNTKYLDNMWRIVKSNQKYYRISFLILSVISFVRATVQFELHYSLDWDIMSDILLRYKHTGTVIEQPYSFLLPWLSSYLAPYTGAVGLAHTMFLCSAIATAACLSIVFLLTSRAVHSEYGEVRHQPATLPFSAALFCFSAYAFYAASSGGDDNLYQVTFLLLAVFALARKSKAGAAGIVLSGLLLAVAVAFHFQAVTAVPLAMLLLYRRRYSRTQILTWVVTLSVFFLILTLASGALFDLIARATATLGSSPGSLTIAGPLGRNSQFTLLVSGIVRSFAPLPVSAERIFMLPGATAAFGAGCILVFGAIIVAAVKITAAAGLRSASDDLALIEFCLWFTLMGGLFAAVTEPNGPERWVQVIPFLTIALARMVAPLQRRSWFLRYGLLLSCIVLTGMSLAGRPLLEKVRNGFLLSNDLVLAVADLKGPLVVSYQLEMAALHRNEETCIVDPYVQLLRCWKLGEVIYVSPLEMTKPLTLQEMEYLSCGEAASEVVQQRVCSPDQGMNCAAFKELQCRAFVKR